MYALKVSQNGKDFICYFQNRRLRKYPSTQNALNAAKQLMNNPKNKMNTIIVYEVSKEESIIYVRRSSKGDVSVEYCKKDKITDTKKKVPISDLIEIRDVKQERVRKLEDTYKKYKEKKEKQPVSSSNCVNRLADSELVNKLSSFFEEFNEAAIEQAIKNNDYRTLFNLEVALSQKEYSWYVDDKNHICVRPTKQVLEMLNKINHE